MCATWSTKSHSDVNLRSGCNRSAATKAPLKGGLEVVKEKEAAI